jgi:phage shock protein PspC (stress-responsive transcriptional regulator)
MVRRRDRRMLAGVCAAVAEGLGVSTALVRWGFLFFALFGVGELVYLVLWVLLPKER